MLELERTKLATGRTALLELPTGQDRQHQEYRPNTHTRARTHTQTTVFSLSFSLSCSRARALSLFFSISHLPHPPAPPSTLAHIPTYSHTGQERDLYYNARAKSSSNPCYPLGRRRNAGTAKGIKNIPKHFDSGGLAAVAGGVW